MDRRYTYIASDNTGTTTGTALGADNQDIAIYQIHFGAPSDGDSLIVYDKVNPVGSATTNIAFNFTQATHAEGTDFMRVVDFGEKGLQIGEGGNVATTANQVTIIWGVI
jgi:hypothetical protein